MPAWRRSGAARLLAVLLGLAGTGGAGAAEAQIDAAGFRLRYDDAIWTREPSAPPTILTLRCGAPACPPHAVATFLHDERNLVSPGFAAFGPGAAIGAAIELRVQSLTPGARIRAREPIAPVTSGDMPCYRGLFDVEDRALAKTAAAIALLRLDGATLEIRMKADRLTPADLALFDRLLEGLVRRD